MEINFKTFHSNEERRAAFMNMIHAKDQWETRMQKLISSQSVGTV